MMLASDHVDADEHAPDGAGREMRRVAPLQATLLSWIGRRSGLAGAHLPDPATHHERVLAFGAFLVGALDAHAEAADMERIVGETAGLDSRHVTPHAHKARDAFANKPWIRWAAGQFLGRSPVPRESTKLSKALSALERRGLIVKRDGANGEGAKPRTSHVRLTSAGVKVALQILRAETGRAAALRLVALADNPASERTKQYRFLRSWTILDGSHVRYFRKGAWADLEPSTARDLLEGDPAAERTVDRPIIEGPF